MYSKVKSFLDKLSDGGNEVIEFSQEDSRLAIAVLYYRVILVDGRIREAEIERFRSILSDSLDVHEDELILFEQHVLEQSKSEASLFPFTTIIKKLPLEKRVEILRHMQQISISDKELHEFEINLVARTAELIGLDTDWVDSEIGDLDKDE